MDALLVSTVFGLGLLFLFDGLVRPNVRIGAIGWFRRLGPRSVAAAVGAMVGFIATGWPIAALAGGLVAAAVPEILRRTREERTRLERREAIAEISSRLRDAIRSGIGLADAFTNVAVHAPATIRADLRRLVSDARVSGLAEAAPRLRGSRFRSVGGSARIRARDRRTARLPQPLRGARCLGRGDYRAGSGRQGGTSPSDPEPGLRTDRGGGPHPAPAGDPPG